MKKRYEVVFLGTEAAGDERIAVMARIQDALKLNDDKLINLFEQPAGAVLLRTSRETKAERLAGLIARAGAHCSIRDTEDESRDWESWELVEKAEKRYQVFHCRACNHSERLPLTQALPAACPECSVIVSKYDKVAQKKLERERVRRKVLSLEQAKLKKATEAEEQAHEAALRKEIEREIRRELGLNRTLADYLKSIAAAGVVFAIGATSTIAYYTYSEFGIQREPQSVQAPSTANPFFDGLENQHTVFLANELLDKLSGGTWAADVDIDAAVNELTPNAEPWLTAPATAAGEPVQPLEPEGSDGRQAPSRAKPTIASDETADIIDFWYRMLDSNPTTKLRLRNLVGDLVNANLVDEAIEAIRLADSTQEQLNLLLTVTTHVSINSDSPLQKQVEERLSAATGSGRTADADRVIRLLALESLRGADAAMGATQSIESELITLANDRQPDTVENISLCAVIAAHRAKGGDVKRASYWFAEANRALDALDDPVSKLLALTYLARAYHTANDPQTAERLARRIEAGVNALPDSTAALDLLADELVLTYATLRLVDAAAAATTLIPRFKAATELRRGALAVDLAAGGHAIAARGVATTITHPAARTRLQAQLSTIAQLQGHTAAAQRLAGEARFGTRSLGFPVDQVVTSQLDPSNWRVRTPAETVDKPFLTTTGQDIDADKALAIIANNLAWGRANHAAQRAAGQINAKELRLQVQQRISVLAKAFDTIGRSQLASARQ